MVFSRLLLGWAGVVELGLLTFPGAFALCMRLRRSRRPVAMPSSNGQPRLVFLVPAYNERLLVRACVRALLSQDYPPDRRRVVVIADNSNDETAKIAREEGAEVLERTDLKRRGKPYALAWALHRLGVAGIDAFVVIDADSEVNPDFAAQLAKCGDVRCGAIQTYFGMSNEYETWLTRLAGLLMRLRYEYQFPAKHRAGLNVPLTGNGMVLGADLLQRRPWNAYSVTEDWELYAEYTAHGEAINYAVKARLESQEARSTAQSATQRERWQAGRRGVRQRWGRAIRASRQISLAQKIDAHIELYWPSPAIHLGGVMFGVTFAVLGGMPSSTVSVALGAAVSEMALGLAVIIYRHPQPWATLRALTWTPVYVVWRLAIGFRAHLSRRARSEWVRTVRHEHR